MPEERQETPTSAGVSVRANAALVCCSALSVLGALAALAALLGLAGRHPETSNSVLDVIRDLRNSPDAGALEGPVEDLFAHKQLAMLLLLGSLAATAGATALYLRVFRRATRPLTGHQEPPLSGSGPLGAVMRVLIAALIVLAGVCVIVTGSLAHAIGDVAGISGDAIVSWDIVKWPLVVMMAFAAFAALQRSAFSDPRVLAASSVTSAQVLAALAWAFAITGFALYLASFDTFEGTYGTIGSGIVLLVWLTMFTMLYYVTPDFHLSGAAVLGAGAALSTFAWLAVNGVMAACLVAFAPLDGWLAALCGGAVLLAALWCSNTVVLLGVRLNALGTVGPATAPPAPAIRRLEPAPRVSRDEELARVVSEALQDDVAHDALLGPLVLAEDEAAGMSDLELDLTDWAFTYGVAWAAARAQGPEDSDDVVAGRALAAARRVFDLYCGNEQWEEHLRGQIRRRSPARDLIAGHVEGAAGNGHSDYGLLR